MGNGNFLKLVNGRPVSASTDVTIYDESTVIGGGGLSSGTPLTLPAAQTYTSLELEVYLNGQRLEDVVDYNFVASPPRTQVTFTFDLVQNDLVRFRIDRAP